MEYGSKLSPEDDYEVRNDTLEADKNTDDTTTAKQIATTSTKQDQYIKENTGT